MRYPRSNFSVIVCLMILLVGVWFARAGTLTPPAGPIAPTMKTLDDLSAQISGISGGAGGGGIKQVIRGVVTYPLSQEELSQDLSATINPAKSIVLLSPACATDYNATTAAMAGRNGACVTNLMASQISIRVETSVRVAPMKVSYQIIEYY